MKVIVNTENLYNRISNLLKTSRERTMRGINTTSKMKKFYKIYGISQTLSEKFKFHGLIILFL